MNHPLTLRQTITATKDEEVSKRFTSNLARRKFANLAFKLTCGLAVIFCLGLLGLLLGAIIYQGYDWLTPEFFQNFTSRFPEKAGIKAGIYGSIYMIILTMLFSVPTGVGAAIYLTEVMANSRWKKIIMANIANLAGVPSILFGILGLAIFVRWLALDRSILAGALTLALVILPIIIIAATEALKAVPDNIRHGARALGATPWQTVRDHILPCCWAEVLTGVILAVSRAFGETAPLIIVGALSYVAFTPDNIMDYFTTLPIQIFNWTARPQEEFHHLAAAGIIVLMVILLAANSFAIILRNSFKRKIR